MLDLAKLSRELVRTLRGQRSQLALSRHLGYRTNVVYTWEAGRRWPTARDFFRLAARSKIDVFEAIAGFFHERPSFLDGPGAIEGLTPALLSELKGEIPIVVLAERSGYSRYSISRWLSGKCEPRLPELLGLIEATSLRVVDFVARFVDPTSLTSTADKWLELEARRTTAWRFPWSHAVLRALELHDYRAMPTHRPGWLASRLGISASEEASCIEALEAAGLIRWSEGRYDVEEVTVDTRSNPDEARRALKSHWLEVAKGRVEADAPGLYSFNVVSISRSDLEQLREMHVRYFNAARSLVADSTESEAVAVISLQLYELGG